MYDNHTDEEQADPLQVIIETQKEHTATLQRIEDILNQIIT